jgi:hypothetical protein
MSQYLYDIISDHGSGREAPEERYENFSAQEKILFVKTSDLLPQNKTPSLLYGMAKRFYCPASFSKI